MNKNEKEQKSCTKMTASTAALQYSFKKKEKKTVYLHQKYDE